MDYKKNSFFLVYALDAYIQRTSVFYVGEQFSSNNSTLSHMNKLTALQNIRKGTFAIARIVSTKKPLKAFAEKKITKVVLATVRTGIEFKNLAVNADRQTGSLPWGEWETYPYLISHKGNRYLRLYLGNSMKVIYLVDGVKVASQVAKAMLPKNNSTGKPSCITVKEGGLVSLKQKGKELINESV